MPAKRKSRFSSGGHLTDDMTVTLVLDSSLAAVFRDGPEPSLEQQREAWSKHRATLMLPENYDLPPGCRPVGFWRFDMHLEPPPDRWATQIPLLIKMGMIASEEAVRIESAYRGLAPKQVIHESVGTYTLPEDAWTLERRLEEARCAASWHRWRGRAEEASAWAEFAEEITARVAAIPIET
jgi:hypothetical protein